MEQEDFVRLVDSLYEIADFDSTLRNSGEYLGGLEFSTETETTKELKESPETFSNQLEYIEYLESEVIRLNELVKSLQRSKTNETETSKKKYYYGNVW